MTIKELEEKMRVKYQEATEAQQVWEAVLAEMTFIEEEIEAFEQTLLVYRDDKVPEAYEVFENLSEEYCILLNEHAKRTQGLEGTKLPYQVPMTCG